MDPLVSWAVKVDPDFAVANTWVIVPKTLLWPPNTSADWLCRNKFKLPFHQTGVLVDMSIGVAAFVSFYLEDEDDDRLIGFQFYVDDTVRNMRAFVKGAFLLGDTLSMAPGPRGFTHVGGGERVDLDVDGSERCVKRAVTMICAVLRAVTEAPQTGHILTASLANRKRSSKGKKPLYDWHTVTIEPPKPKSEPKGGTGSEKRPHDRRGCWCTVKKTGTKYWRKNCTINKHKEGFIFKDYVVKPGDTSVST